MRRVVVGLALAVLVILAGGIEVAFSQDNGLEQGMLAIEAHSEDGFSGQFAFDGGMIGFELAAVSKTASTIDVVVNGKPLFLEIDIQTRSLLVDGNDAILTENEKEGLLAMSQALTRYLLLKGNGSLTTHELNFLRITEYWSQAPASYQYGWRQVSAKATKGISANEGIKCVDKGRTYTVKYDDSRGDHAYGVKVNSTGTNQSGQSVSSYGCMGRCGANCGWGAPSSWCKDCLDHDECSVKNNSSGGSSDSNCGDEFNEAMDDWMFGVISGCWG